MISFVFPAYNEAENLRRFPAEVFPVFRALGKPFEVVIVDDGSKDDTQAVARGLQETEPAVRVVPHERNMGLGAAVKTGIREARGDLIVTLDSDLTFAPALVQQLLARFERGDVDVVSGSPKLAGFDKDIPAYRVAMSVAATVVYSVALGRRITAVSPILRLYRAADVKALDLKTDGFDINAEILFKLVQRRCRIAEIPAPLTVRIHGESKLVYSREIRRHLKLVATMLRWRVAGLVPAAHP